MNEHLHLNVINLLTFFVGDGNTEEGDERYDWYHGENGAYD